MMVVNFNYCSGLTPTHLQLHTHTQMDSPPPTHMMYTHTRTHARVHTHMRAHIRSCKHAHMHTHIHAHTYTCTHIHTCACVISPKILSVTIDSIFKNRKLNNMTIFEQQLFVTGLHNGKGCHGINLLQYHLQ